MSKTVGLRDELYEKLAQQARMQNITVEQIIEGIIIEHTRGHLDSMKATVAG